MVPELVQLLEHLLSVFFFQGRDIGGLDAADEFGGFHALGDGMDFQIVKLWRKMTEVLEDLGVLSEVVADVFEAQEFVDALVDLETLEEVDKVVAETRLVSIFKIGEISERLADEGNAWNFGLFPLNTIQLSLTHQSHQSLLGQKDLRADSTPREFETVDGSVLESSKDLKDSIVVVETEEVKSQDHESPKDNGSFFGVFFMEDRGNYPVADDVEAFGDGCDGWCLFGLGGFGPCLMHQLSVLHTGVGLVLHH